MNQKEQNALIEMLLVMNYNMKIAKLFFSVDHI